MRRVIFGGATSLDNFLARPDGSVDWLMWSREAAAVTNAFWTTIDTVLMGRKTYEVAVGMGQDAGSPGMKTFVFSRTLTKMPGGGGIPAFHPMSRQIDLELKDCERFTNGCVYVTYRVKRKA